MVGHSWENNASYRRRIVAILSGVLLALALVLFFTRRAIPPDMYKSVGWRGELELLPEITVEPDPPAPDATPARTERTESENVALDAAQTPGEFQPDLPHADKPPHEAVASAMDGDGNASSLSIPKQEQVSYSDTYVILRMMKPQYPPKERAEGIEGNVLVALLVDERGLVSEVTVLELLGPQSFQDAALEAARLFLFQPPTDGRGNPTSMWVKFLIKFRVYG